MNNSKEQKIGDKKTPEAKEEQQEQQPVSDFKNNGWKEHLDGEVVKLELGESITGTLKDKSISTKYDDCYIYKFEVDDDPVPKVILGSKQLDRLMVTVDVGQIVKILFEGTRPSDKGQPMKIFKVWTKD